MTGDGLEAVYTYERIGHPDIQESERHHNRIPDSGGSVLSEKKNGVWQHYLYDGSGQLMASDIRVRITIMYVTV